MKLDWLHHLNDALGLLPEWAFTLLVAGLAGWVLWAALDLIGAH